jgi:hypothetical protein
MKTLITESILIDWYDSIILNLEILNSRLNYSRSQMYLYIVYKTSLADY